jgi:AraC family transcriptional activator FtrA
MTPIGGYANLRQYSASLGDAVLPPNPLVVALVYDGLCSFEFGCAAEVFGLPRPEMGPDWYRFASCAIEPGPLRALGGLSVQADGGVKLLAQAGTIVIPGWKGVDVEPRPELLELLRKAHARGARILTICSGVFVLAATGLLNGRAATTHWRYAEALARRYPGVHVDPNVLYIDEGQLLTSAGSAAGLDLCLHLVRRDYGAEAANQVARRLVIAPHRDGGQAQFIERPVPNEPGSRLSALLADMQAGLDQPWSAPRAAQAAGMSERTLLRRFREATGLTPADWLIAARVERARELLESSRRSIEEVAHLSGFGAATTLRHHFQRRLGVSPAAYRQRFLRRPQPA